MTSLRLQGPGNTAASASQLPTAPSFVPKPTRPVRAAAAVSGSSARPREVLPSEYLNPFFDCGSAEEAEYPPFGVLQVYTTEPDEEGEVEDVVLYNECKDHAELEEYLSPAQEHTIQLRILFLFDDQPEAGTKISIAGTQKRSTISSNTARLLYEKLGVSPMYLSILRFGDSMGLCYLKNPYFEDSDNIFEADTLAPIEGVYDFCDGSEECADSTWVWFTHSPQSSNYIIKMRGRNSVLVDILDYIQDPAAALLLLRPLVVDALIASRAFVNIANRIAEATGPLGEYERTAVYSKLSPEPGRRSEIDYTKSILGLQVLSNQWADYRFMLSTSVDRLMYLARVYATLFAMAADNKCDPRFVPQKAKDHVRNAPDIGWDNEEVVSDALAQLISACKTQMMWLERYASRTQAQLSLHYTLAAQRSSETNLQIAQLTSKIAEETQKDSSSMITIATLTMLFLPATFVAAVFSMPFFEATTSPEQTFAVSSKFWLFPTIAVPLTLIIFVGWNAWRVRRNRTRIRERNDARSRDLEVGDVDDAVAEARSEGSSVKVGGGVRRRA